VETAGVEPAPPRCKRGALPSEPRPHACVFERRECSSGGKPPLDHPRYAAEHRFDNYVSCGQGGSDPVPAVPNHVHVAVTSDAYRRGIAALLEPLGGDLVAGRL
jgi:hypothetical protein